MKKYEYKNVLKISLALLLLYFLHFIIAPKVLPKYYPNFLIAKEIFWVGLILCITLCMIFVTRKMRYWVVGNLAYLIPIEIYSAYGAYGIGVTGWDFDDSSSSFSQDGVFGSLILIYICMLIIESVISGIISLASIIYRKLKDSKK